MNQYPNQSNLLRVILSRSRQDMFKPKLLLLTLMVFIGVCIIYSILWFTLSISTIQILSNWINQWIGLPWLSYILAWCILHILGLIIANLILFNLVGVCMMPIIRKDISQQYSITHHQRYNLIQQLGFALIALLKYCVCAMISLPLLFIPVVGFIFHYWLLSRYTAKTYFFDALADTVSTSEWQIVSKKYMQVATQLALIGCLLTLMPIIGTLLGLCFLAVSFCHLGFHVISIERTQQTSS